jgi:hypothetical protein
VPIDWNTRIRAACNQAAAKGVKVESIVLGGGWFVQLPGAKKKRITGAAKLISLIEEYQPPQTS